MSRAACIAGIPLVLLAGAPECLALTDEKVVQVAPGATNRFFVSFEPRAAASTLRLLVNAAGPVQLLEETVTVIADKTLVAFRKIRRTSKIVVFEAADVPAAVFVAARLDGTYTVSTMKTRSVLRYSASFSDLDLDADSDHTGLVEHSAREDELEDKDGQEGVIVLPNWNDDGGHGVPNCLVENQFARVAFADRAERFDNRINGPKDRRENMELLTIRKIPRFPANWKVTLRISESDAEKIRIFDEADQPVIIPKDAARWIPEKKGALHNEHVIANVQGPANNFLNYHIEGILPGERLIIELVAFEGAQERVKDVVKSRVAPFLLLPNDRPVRQAFVADFRSVPDVLRLGVLPGLGLAEDAVRQTISRFVKTTTAPASVAFWQDPIVAGYAQAPGAGGVRTRILLARLPEGAGNFVNAKAGVSVPDAVRRKSLESHWLWPNRPSDFFAPPTKQHASLLGPEIGVFEIADLAAGDAVPPNYGGNIQLTWPLAGDGVPFGRVVTGKEMAAKYRDFFRRQQVQAPLVELDLSWLFIKHVDEVAYFWPGRRVVVPSPAEGEALLTEFFQQHPEPGRPVFLKGAEIASGRLSDVRTHGPQLVLTVLGDLRAVHPDMYLHVFRGKARYQTYLIHAVGNDSITVRQQDAQLLSFWRDGPIELPASGSEYVVFDQPLHDRKSRVLTLTLSELLDRGHNPKVRDFWGANVTVERNVTQRILPEIAKVAPSGIIRLPVLFHEVSDPDFGSGSTAFTPNLVNGHLLQTTFLMPKPFVLRTSGGDLFEQAATKALTGFKSEFVDDYFLFHNSFGEIHCAANVIREPPASGPYWWEHGDNLRIKR